MENLENRIPVYECQYTIDDTEDNDISMGQPKKKRGKLLANSLVNDPAILLPFLTFAKEKIEKFETYDNEKRIIVGCAMQAGMRIIRGANEEIPHEHYLYYKGDVIRNMVEDYIAEGSLNNFTLSHQTKASGIRTVETWFSSQGGKEEKLGFTVPENSWMIALRVQKNKAGNEIWNNYIKTGKVLGFSVECLFPDLIQVFENESKGIESDEVLLEKLRNAILEFDNVNK